MKWKFMAGTVARLIAFLSISEIPINAQNKEVDFTAEQDAALIKALGEEDVAKVKEALNKEIKAMNDDSLQMKSIQDEIDAMVAETNLTEEELREAANGQNTEGNFDSKIKALAEKFKQQNAMLAKLVNMDIGDVPEAIIKNMPNMKITHSATHLFATGKDWDALDRPWNKRAASNSPSATNFADQPTVQKLNDDLALYYRENPTELKSLTRDSYGLPTFWPTRTKVDDKVADGSIATADISQSRKLPWLPKNKQTIQAEQGQIFPIQIDIEFVGYFLQKIEASWLNMMNKEGSQPYKESFVKFLVSEIDKKARIEDRIATIKGIYVETPENATEGGRFINRQNGLFYLLQQARDVTQKYRPFDLGLPTTTNIVDYVDEFIKRLPQDVREQQGLVLYLSDEWLRAYKRRYEVLHSVQNDYEGYPKNPKDYPNVAFERLIDAAGSDFMFMTFNDNIELLENVPAEKSMYKFEYLLRKMYIWADYKMGVRLIHIGNTVEAGDPDEFKVQTVWSNTAPVFPAETFIPLHETGTTKLKAVYNNYHVTAGRTSTITEIENRASLLGQVIKIKGNTALAATLNVVHSATKLKLAGSANFDLKTGGTLVLFIPEDGTVPVELYRTAAPDTTVVANARFSTATVDANLGEVFDFAGSVTTAITSVINGVPGKTIKIVGTDTAGVDVTLSTVGNIKLASAATLAIAADYVELTLVDGYWRETKRVIA